MWYFFLGVVAGIVIEFVIWILVIFLSGSRKKNVGTLWVDRSTSIYDIYFEVNDWDSLAKNRSANIEIRGTRTKNISFNGEIQ